MRLPDRPPAKGRPAGRFAVVAGLGLLTGVAFVLPVLCYLDDMTGRGGMLLLLFVAVIAVIVVRGSGKVLGVVMEASPRPWRLPMLALYGLIAMAVLATLLLQPR